MKTLQEKLEAATKALEFYAFGKHILDPSLNEWNEPAGYEMYTDLLVETGGRAAEALNALKEKTSDDPKCVLHEAASSKCRCRYVV